MCMNNPPAQSSYTAPPLVMLPVGARLESLEHVNSASFACNASIKMQEVNGTLDFTFTLFLMGHFS